MPTYYDPRPSDAIGSGNGSVTTAGTRVQLSDQACKRVWIECNSENGALTNGGVIVVGGSNVVAVETSRLGKALFPGQGDWFNVPNLNLLYVDSTDSTAKYHYYFE